MKRILLLSFLYSITLSSQAQTPDDALRTAWFSQNGTARNMAVGGVMGSLGGDLTAAHVNPAGIGLYKTREFLLSPGFNFNNNQFNYRGSDTSNKKNNFNYGCIGLIIGTPTNNPNSKWVSSAFAVSVNELANYNNHYHFSGYNNYSSFSEQYLEELTRDGADTIAALDNYIFGSSLAFRTFLIDTLGGPGGTIAGYRTLASTATGLLQQYDAATRGGYHEVAISFAGSMQDKWYLGASLTIPIISYQRDLNYSETDATNNPNNKFSNFQYSESFKSSGAGIGLKLGAIYKPKDYWRLGFALHTPQWISYTDHIRASMTTNTEAYAGIKTESSDNLNDGNAGERKYEIITPWRAIASASYVFREVHDTRKQRAFISADIEYVNYRGARFSTSDPDAEQSQKDYLKLVNSEVKDYYKGNINIRLGGELKFNVWAFRLGGAYYGSPYKDSDLKANKFIASGGFGYRNHGIFIDIAYSAAFNKDAVFAYRLNDKANTFAQQSGSKGTVMLTVGFKF